MRTPTVCIPDQSGRRLALSRLALGLCLGAWLLGALGCDPFIPFQLCAREGPRPLVRVVSAEEAAKAPGRPLTGVRVIVWSCDQDLYKGHPELVKQTGPDGATEQCLIYGLPYWMRPVFYFLCEKEGYLPVSGSFVGERPSPDFSRVLVFMKPEDGPQTPEGESDEASRAGP